MSRRFTFEELLPIVCRRCDGNRRHRKRDELDWLAIRNQPRGGGLLHAFSRGWPTSLCGYHDRSTR